MGGAGPPRPGRVAAPCAAAPVCAKRTGRAVLAVFVVSVAEGVYAGMIASRQPAPGWLARTPGITRR